ncbi:MAG TPA: glycosyltransferase [Marinobacter sp.]|nr:glycosyltransferase [Marinobacter sp.]
MNTPARLAIIQLIATPGTSWGGMEKHTADLSEELARRGHKVHVVAHPDYQHHFSEATEFHPLPVQLGRRNLWLKWRLRQTLRKLSPDVLHAQGNKAAALASGIEKQGCITVGTIHGTKSSHKAFRKLDGVIAVSKGIQDTLLQANTRLIHNGIKSQDTRAETTNPIPDSGAFALAIGRLEPVKQFDKLIAAWVTLEAPMPLYILGAGSEEESLKAKIRSFGAENLIKLPGYEHNPTAWLKRASVCLVSSEREGFPYALIEALLARCPVLSTPVNGALDLLPPKSLAESTGLNAIKALLSAQLADIENLKKSQEACFDRAALELTLEAMASRTEAFYYELLDKNAAPLTT